MVQIKDEHFEEVVKYIEKLEDEIRRLREANEFMVEEIKEYKKKFGGDPKSMLK